MLVRSLNSVARVGVQCRQCAGDRPAGGSGMRVGAPASAVRDHDPGAPPVPTAVESEHRRDDLAIERQPAVGAAEPAGRTAAPRRPLPEPARRPGLYIFVPRAGVKERTSQQRRAKIRQGLRVRQTQGAQQGALAARPLSVAPALRSTPPSPTGPVFLSVTVIPGPVPPPPVPAAPDGANSRAQDASVRTGSPRSSAVSRAACPTRPIHPNSAPVCTPPMVRCEACGPPCQRLEPHPRHGPWRRVRTAPATPAPADGRSQSSPSSPGRCLPRSRPHREGVPLPVGQSGDRFLQIEARIDPGPAVVDRILVAEDRGPAVA